MKAIILAAGNGIRMRPLTDILPKPLLTVGRKALLDHLVGAFPKDIDELIIVTRYLGDKINNFCGTKFHGRPVSYVNQPHNIHGTYSALKICEPLLKKNERFFVFYADDLLSSKAIRECLKYTYAIVASEVAEPKNFGVVELRDDHTLKGISEKPEHPSTNFVLTNALLLDTKIFRFDPPVNANGERYLTHAVCELAKAEKIHVVTTDRWLPIGYPSDIQRAEEFLKK